MDEGLPIAYEVLEKGVPVLASDGEQVGTVRPRLAAPEKDIFHGLVIATPATACASWRRRTIASLHEHGVDLRIDSAAAQSLPAAGRRGAGVRRGSRRAAKGGATGCNMLTGARRLETRALSRAPRARQPAAQSTR